MKIHITYNQKDYKVDFSKAIDLSIPLIFNGDQPNLYNVPKAAAQVFEGDGFVGDTRRGGGCNFENYQLCTHLNGTHTECVGHITNKRIYINEVLKNELIPATLITVSPEYSSQQNEFYTPPLEKDDQIITKKILTEVLSNYDKNFLIGLIIRTLPNDPSKKSRRYMEHPAPFFTLEAIEFINELGIEHLVMDTPSVDRMFDDGKLSVHHAYWNIPQGSHEVDENNISTKTITEMAFIPDEVSDGQYFLQIQIPNFTADAAPSRPMLYQPE